MKLKNILISGLGVLALSSCNDYLDVDAPSSYTTDFIYDSETEANTALNGVYSQILSGNTFGNLLYSNMMLNSDVDFTANANNSAQGGEARRFDLRSDASNVEKLWDQLYKGIESANEFIYNMEKSSLYAEGEEEYAGEGGIKLTRPAVTTATQMAGEAKVMRAMMYHELLAYWGDVPFTMQATYETGNLIPAIEKREVISKALIEDLKHAAEYMYSDSSSVINAPERISQEAAYAMIARLALQAGGYSLNHDEGDNNGYKMTRPDNYKGYYTIAQEYTKKIIDRKGHKLSKDFRDVFIDECNFIVNKGDDAIFEIPFAKESTGNWGYAQGPAASSTNGETTYGPYGATSGGARTSHFYRYMFKEGDARRDYICGMWGYAETGLPAIRFDYAMANNKWSKLWNTTGLGANTTGNTGINFAYIRYADVLLMFAEAENELNDGPTAAAKEALKEVRERAFRNADNKQEMVVDYVDALSTKKDFLWAVLEERKFEFAGENMRWKDLVRNNLYSETLFYTYLAYRSFAENMGGASDYIELANDYFGINIEEMPTEMHWCYIKPDAEGADKNFPNNTLYKIFILNPYTFAPVPTTKPNNHTLTKDIAVTELAIRGSGSKDYAWSTRTIDWYNEGALTGQIHYSLYGYIRSSEITGEMTIVGMDGMVNPLSIADDPSQLPAVRYILPYPEEAIMRSSGAYKNNYGY